MERTPLLPGVMALSPALRLRQFADLLYLFPTERQRRPCRRADILDLEGVGRAGVVLGDTRRQNEFIADRAGAG
jgi:hypothetical protein